MMMDTSVTEPMEEPIAETPEDVAILYSWANLQGAKYRDFSASRREYRAQIRHRAAEETRQAELNAQADAEQAAAESERTAREAERAARISGRYDSQVDRERALREADDAARRAAAERVEAARRAEAAAVAEAAARQEEREIAEAHASAQRQAARWYDSEVRLRTLAGPQPTRVPAMSGDPYELQQGATVDGDLPSSNRALEYTQPQRYRDDIRRNERQDTPLENRSERTYERGVSGISERRAPRAQPVETRRPRGFQPDQDSGMRPAYPPNDPTGVLRPYAADENRGTPVGSRGQAAVDLFDPRDPRDPRDLRDLRDPRDLRDDRDPRDQRDVRGLRTAQQDLYPTEPRRRPEDQSWEQGLDTATPAWLNSGQGSTARSYGSPKPLASVVDTLQHSRERVASRWFALKGVFEADQQSVATGTPVPASTPSRELRVPVLAVFSLAGGVGKTSLVATLGRALSALGEKVLLADTTSHGLLPYYFGATELKNGVVRTFSPPAGSMDAAIHLVSYDCDGNDTDRTRQDTVLDELVASASTSNRMLLDLTPSTGWIIHRGTRIHPMVLVPLAPDMNSVISLQAVEKYFSGVLDGEGRPLHPFYVINQFDSTLPLHLDVREVLRRQLAERLLTCVIRRSPAVSEALAEGMTVMDYAPTNPVSEDFMNVANWLRGVSAPAAQAARNARWSER